MLCISHMGELNLRHMKDTWSPRWIHTMSSKPQLKDTKYRHIICFHHICCNKTSWTFKTKPRAGLNTINFVYAYGCIYISWWAHEKCITVKRAPHMIKNLLQGKRATSWQKTNMLRNIIIYLVTMCFTPVKPFKIHLTSGYRRKRFIWVNSWTTVYSIFIIFI